MEGLLANEIQRVLDACRPTGVPKPRIQVDAGELWVQFAFSAACLESISGRDDRRETAEASGKTSVEIVSMIRSDPRITIPEMAERLKKTTRAIEMQLAKLQAAGVVIRVGPAKGGHWEIVGEEDV